jgi:hypothetical protein
MTEEVEESRTTADSNPDVHARKPAAGKKRDRGDWQLEVRKNRFCEVALQRDAEAQRYIEANIDRYGLGGVLERWRQYEAGIVAKYQGPDADYCSDRILDAAWLARDRAHANPIRRKI